MSKDTKKQASRVKTKKKLWYKIISPKLFGEREIGETYLTSPEAALGRTLKINLKELTNNVKDQNTAVVFQIQKIDGSSLKTNVCGLELSPSFVKRMVRKDTDRVDDYFVFKTKDGQEVIVKTLLITQSKINRARTAELSRQLQELLREEISKTDFVSFVDDLVNKKFKNLARKKLTKIYPLKEIAVRILKLNTKQGKTESGAKEEKTDNLPSSSPLDLKS